MKQRVITGLCLGLVLIPLIILGGWFMFGLTLLLSYVATFELVKMHSEKHNLSKRFKYVVPLFSVMLVALCELSIKLPLYFDLTDVVFSVILIFALLLICSLFIGHIKTSDIMMFFGFILYGGLGIFMAFSSRFIKHIDGINYDNLGLILFGYVILTTVFTDMGAYTFGLLCGKHKLCPTISPKKTIEGAIGGSFTGALVGSIVMLVGERVIGFSLLGLENELLNIVSIATISLVITIIAQFGDLVASKLKREYGIKDYGFIFPGHGGVMDRFDSLIMTGTFFFILLSMIGVIL